MTIQALGYLGLQATDLDTWASFGERLLGLQIAERHRDALRFRMDDRAQRLTVLPSDRGGLAHAGWEVADAAALQALAARLESRGIAVTAMDESTCAATSAGSSESTATTNGRSVAAVTEITTPSGVRRPTTTAPDRPSGDKAILRSTVG